jgi:hypothetical protein
MVGPKDLKLGKHLGRWRECDERDRLTAVLVVLCGACSKKLIDPHPRLYHYVAANDPCPGAMAICADCPYREGLSCTFPDLLRLRHERRKPVMVDFGGKDRPQSGGYALYLTPPSDCSGKRHARRYHPPRTGWQFPEERAWMDGPLRVEAVPTQGSCQTGTGPDEECGEVASVQLRWPGGHSLDVCDRCLEIVWAPGWKRLR